METDPRVTTKQAGIGDRLEVIASVSSFSAVAPPITVADAPAALAPAPKPYIMVVPCVPDAATLQALGIVSVRYGQLEYALRMTVKSLTGLDVREALDSTRFTSAKALRERILAKARKKLSEQRDVDALANLIDRTAAMTLRRNDVLHGFYARELDGESRLFANDTWQAVPTPDELTALAAQIAGITDEIQDARLNGLLAEALREQR